MKKKQKRLLIILFFFLATFLRFYQIGKNPPSLYWDEAAIALDAYSLSETGRDMNNMSIWQPVFGSYGDFKAPILIILSSVSVRLLGMNALAIRLPMAIFSLLTLGVAYFLVKEVLAFDKHLKEKYQLLPLMVLFILAISPWPVHFGRIAFESSLSVFFLLLTLLFYIKGIKGKKYWILLAVLPGVLAVYTYYSLRVIVPLFIFFLTLIFFKKVWPKKVLSLLLAMMIFIAAVMPILRSPYYARSQDYRLNNDNLIRSQKVIAQSSKYLERYRSSPLARLLYHRYLFWSRDFLQNFSSHFSLDFLFINGDANLRQHSGYWGEFLVILMPVYLIGLFLLAKNLKSKTAQFLLIFLFLAPIPASMVYEVPHASRAIYLFVPFSIIIAWGLLELFNFLARLKNQVYKKFLMFAVVLLILLNATFYYLDYFIDYPKRSSAKWLYQYNQVAEYIKDHYQEFRSISIDERYWFPIIFVYYQFPELVIELQQLKNAFLNSPVYSFGLPDPFVYLLDADDDQKKEAQFIYYENEIPTGFVEIEKFNFLNGEPSLKLIVKEPENYD
jgi:4-amino-4-deoxy-L-arabinose transferase-like glycosyltransferase